MDEEKVLYDNEMEETSCFCQVKPIWSEIIIES